MVFNLNFIGTLLPTSLRPPDGGPPGLQHPQHLQHECLPALTKIPAYSGSKAAVTNFTQWLAVHFSKVASG